MTIHAVVTRGVEDDKIWFTAQCLEVSVVTQGGTLDELVGNLGEAISLHLCGDPPVLGAVARVSVIYEMAVTIS